MEDAYWSQKKKHTNIFDAPSASAELAPGQGGQYALSARQRPGQSRAPALAPANRSFTIASPAPNPATPVSSYDGTSPASMEKLQCLQCEKLFTADLLTVYEGKKAFEDRNCRSMFIERVARQLTKVRS